MLFRSFGHGSQVLTIDKIFMFADGDQAGHEFAKSLMKELSNVIVIQMPEGEDVNSMYLKNGATYFQDKVATIQ